jgi:dipeptidyl aminopeptidase/acylaminoacyl peptidase
LLHPEKKPIDTFSSNIVPEYRDISFKGTDKNILLKGWLFPSKNSDRTVILAHSYGNKRLEFGIKTVDLIKEFLNRGYNVFTFDMRNSGESGGKDTTFGYSEKEDIKAAISYMNSQGSSHITLMGFSTGASASILAAAESESVDAVIADSPYADLNTYLSQSLNRWTHLPSFPFNKTVSFAMEVTGSIESANASPVNALTAEKPPYMLLIHGQKDKLIPVENSIELYQKYSALNSSGAEYWWTDDDGNATSFEKYPDEYLSKVFAFLEKAGAVGDRSQYNNSLYHQISDYDERIDKLNDELISKENSYYSQFAQLETLINNMNSQSSWLSQQFS